MIDARDRLTADISSATDHWAYPLGMANAEVIAADLEAKGYSKPRTITTAQELDALPVGSVVLRNGRAFQRFAPTPAAFDEYKQWRCTDGGFVRSTKDGSSILPATVLYEPQP